LRLAKKVSTIFWRTMWERFGVVSIKTRDASSIYRHIFKDKETLRASILSSLHENLASQNTRINSEMMAGLAERVIAHVEHRKALSLKDHLEKHHPEIISNRLEVLQMAFGTMCYWEMIILNLARKFEIEIYSDRTHDNETREIRNLRSIILDIERRTPGIRLDLHPFRKVRNAIVHSNFHQVILKARDLPSGANFDLGRSSVFMARLSTGTVSNLSDMTGFDEFQTVDQFGWLLASAGGDLLEIIISDFRDCCENIETLVHFHALAHSGNEHLRSQIFERGEAIGDEDLTRFRASCVEFGRPEEWVNALALKVNSLLTPTP
jgi:hypothetical protein